jgi:acetyl-CoA carboxylase carboxyl transferase subunit beta
MSWWTRDTKAIQTPEEGPKHVRTEGLWTKCEGCGQVIWRKALEEGMQVCPKCGYHFRVDAATRLKQLFDNGEFNEHDAGMTSTDPLEFVDSKPYHQRLESMKRSTQKSSMHEE